MIKRHKEPDIFIPKSLVDDWVNSYGQKDLCTTVPQIANAIKAMETCRTAGLSESNDIMEIFHHYVRNNKFFATDLGKYIQIAVLVGHEVNPKKYFKGSDAIWDSKSPMTLVDIALIRNEDSHGNHMIRTKVSYQAFDAGVVKDVVELQCLFY